MKNKSKFPDLSNELYKSLSEVAPTINGGKVLFDKKVTLMPVQVERTNTKGIDGKAKK